MFRRVPETDSTRQNNLFVCSTNQNQSCEKSRISSGWIFKAAALPRPNGIPYKIYKNCPILTQRFWKHLRVVWRTEQLHNSWHQSEGCIVVKKKRTTGRHLKRFVPFPCWTLKRKFPCYFGQGDDDLYAVKRVLVYTCINICAERRARGLGM